MKLQKIKITAVAFLAAATSVTAQNIPVTPPFAALNRPSTVYSPQTEEMIRYDHADIDINTGNLRQRIPLIDLQDKDFDLPLSIVYNGAGFRPQSSDNFVGRDWMLDTGGIIYRTVNGMPDDWDGYRPDGNESDRNTGFLAMLGKKYFNLEKMKKEVKENPYKYAQLRNLFYSHMPTIPPSDGEQNIECSPDVFRFSFGKHSGKFMINYDGSISVVGYDGKKYEVDLSGMKLYSNTQTQETCIRIKTDDGYIYTFGGGGYSSLEYNALSWQGRYNPNPLQSQKPLNEITAYHLTKITAPNGRTLTIHYRDIPQAYHEKPYNIGLLDLDSQHAAEHKELAMQYILNGKRAVAYDSYVVQDAAYIRESNAFGTSSMDNAHEHYSLTKLALIDYIETDQGTIRFHYSLRDKHVLFDGSQPAGFFTECGARLDKVSMYMRNNIQTAYLNYGYDYGNRMFLTSLKTDVEGKYRFEYNLPYLSKVPTPLSCNIDHWGFWRGTDETGALIPRLRQSTESSEDFTIVSDHRNATGKRYDATLLKSITYPTGGRALFTYEPHRYSSIPCYESKSAFYMSMRSPTPERYGIAGGGRINSVRFTDANGKTMQETTYAYGGLPNEGTITYMPFYRLICVQKDQQTGKFKVCGIAFNSEGFEYKANRGAHIRYSTVTEHYVNPEKGGTEQKHAYKTTEFISSYPGFPYVYADNAYCHTLNMIEGIDAPIGKYYTLFPDAYLLHLQHLVAHPTIDLFLYYGKIDKEQYFDENKKLKKKVTYRYNYINDEEYSPCIFMPNANPRLFFCNHFQIGRESFRNLLLSRKEVITYEQEEQKSSRKDEEMYEYDRYGYLIRQVSVRNEGDSLIIENDYRQYDTRQGFQILPDTRKANLGTAEGRKRLWSEHTDYTFPNYSLYGNYWNVPSAVTRYEGSSYRGDHVTYRFHDIYGNPLEIKKNDTESIVYLYGNKGQYLMAKLENTNYHEVSSALGMRADLLSEQDNPAAAIGLLREKLPLANIYTYTYEANGAQINETSPDGKTVHYALDAKKRIYEAYRTGKNGESEVLFHRTYHVVNH